MPAPTTFDVVLEANEDGWYTATVPALPGCISQGATKAEARANIREAIDLYLEEFGDPRETGEGETTFAGITRVRASA